MGQQLKKFTYYLKVVFNPSYALEALASYLIKKKCNKVGYFIKNLSGFWGHAIALYQSHSLLTNETFGISVEYIYTFSSALWVCGLIGLSYYEYKVMCRDKAGRSLPPESKG